MRLIGITGGIACGKSTVSGELLRLGYPVIDGDVISRELTRSHGAAIQDILSVFGASFLLPDGSLNRRKMGALVFSDPNAREQLDRVMAPHLKAASLRKIEAAKASGTQLCFLDMPLLFEKGYDALCDSIWCVWLPQTIQLERLIRRDGFSEEEALCRIRSVMSSDEKANRSSAVIDNSGTVEETLEQLHFLLDREKARAASVPRRRRSSAPIAGLQTTSVPRVPDEKQDAFDRPASSRKKPSERKVSWSIPVWLRAALISAAAVLLICFTAHQLMNAYLVRQQQKHEDEQKAIDLQYPLLYTDLIVKTASEYNLSPALVSAVIRNESSFRPEAESAVHARGLMQLMPDTAQWIAGKLRVDDYTLEMLNDPATNIRFGCWYLNYLCSLFRGDPLCVVCAYHAGQGEVSSWLSNPLMSSDGMSLIYERLPDGPTKQYAGRVTRDYGIYKAKYFSQDPAVASGTDAPADP